LSFYLDVKERKNQDYANNL